MFRVYSICIITHFRAVKYHPMNHSVDSIPSHFQHLQKTPYALSVIKEMQCTQGMGNHFSLILVFIKLLIRRVFFCIFFETFSNSPNIVLVSFDVGRRTCKSLLVIVGVIFQSNRTLFFICKESMHAILRLYDPPSMRKSPRL